MQVRLLLCLPFYRWLLELVYIVGLDFTALTGLRVQIPHHLPSGYDEIGRHAGFRFQCRKKRASSNLANPTKLVKCEYGEIGKCMGFKPPRR